MHTRDARRLAARLGDDMGVTQLVADMITAPKAIRAQQEVAAAAHERLTAGKLALEVCEAALALSVSDELNPETGKPKYANAEVRAAELLVRAQSDPSHIRLRAALGAAQESARVADQDERMLVNEFSARKAASVLLAGHLGFTATLAAERP